MNFVIGDMLFFDSSYIAVGQYQNWWTNKYTWNVLWHHYRLRFFSCWLLLVTPCDTIQFFFSSLAWIDLYNRACLYYTYGYFPHECTTRTTWRTNASHILCAYSKFDYYHYNYVITSWFHFYSHCANDIIRFDFHINPKYWYANKK